MAKRRMGKANRAPEMLCQTAAIAPGMAASGLQYVPAIAEDRPADWVATSIMTTTRPPNLASPGRCVLKLSLGSVCGFTRREGEQAL